MRFGAHDVIERPIAETSIVQRMKTALRLQTLENAFAYHRAADPGRQGVDALLGDSPAMRTLKSQVETTAAERPSRRGRRKSGHVVILGEPGVGKRLAGRALHYSGPRAEQPLIAVACSALPALGLALETPGASTLDDACKNLARLIQLADGGCLLLEEIADLPAAARIWLAEAIADGGARFPHAPARPRYNVRIIATTSRSIDAIGAAAGFDARLSDKLCGEVLNAPPLRDRSADVRLLSEHFLVDSMRRYGRTSLRFTDDALSAMLDYDWPGNLWELRQIIDRGVLRATGARLRARHLGLAAEPTPADAASGRIMLPEDGVALATVERDLIAQAMQRAEGNVSRAARLLGLSRDTLRYRLSKHSKA